MKVVIAIDSLKGSLSSIEAGMAIKEGVLRAKPDAEVIVKPLADGGEGTTDALIEGMNGEQIDLTQVEFQIMELFFRNPGTALVREKILEGVWGKGYFGDVKIVDVNIRRLRMKVEDEPSSPQHILTVWGYGYRWNA